MQTTSNDHHCSKHNRGFINTPLLSGDDQDAAWAAEDLNTNLKMAREGGRGGPVQAQAQPSAQGSSHNGGHRSVSPAETAREWVGQKGVRAATAGLIDIGLETRQVNMNNNDNDDDKNDDAKDEEQSGSDGVSNVLGMPSRLASSALGEILADKVANGGLI